MYVHAIHRKTIKSHDYVSVHSTTGVSEGAKKEEAVSVSKLSSVPVLCKLPLSI